MQTMKQWKEFYKLNPTPPGQLRMTDNVKLLKRVGYISCYKLQNNYIRTIKDIYDVTADGLLAIPGFTIKDLEALRSILKQHNLPEIEGYKVYEHVWDDDARAAEIKEEFLNSEHLWRIEASARTEHALIKAGVKRIRDLGRIMPYHLEEIHGVGPYAVRELEQIKYDYNI